MAAPTFTLTLQTKVGRRIALLFVVSALLPVVALAVIGYVQVRRQLLSQADQQLSQAAKGAGMGILDHLGSARATLAEAGQAAGAAGAPVLSDATELGRRARAMFGSLALARRGGVEVVWGEAPPAAPLQNSGRSLDSGRTVVTIAGSDTMTIWIAMVPPGSPARLWAALRRDRLFGGARERAAIESAETALCVRETERGRTLYCEGLEDASGPRATATWDLFLGYDFDTPPWRIEVARPMQAVLGPLSTFSRTFVATLVAVLGFVVLLSNVQVRRSLEPLTELSAGTRRLARRDFTQAVQVSSRDEFEDLAASFNAMAGELDQQFRTLTAGAAIDQAALTSPRGEDVASEAAGRLLDSLRCHAVDVCLAGERAESPWHHVRAANGTTRAEGTVQPLAPELEALRAARGGWLLRAAGDGFGWLGSFESGGAQILPLIVQDNLIGLVAVHGREAMRDDQLQRARQMCDKLAVGLSNARLIVRLDQLSYGALAALARTVDANSPWTAGHSERVTAFSLRIATRLGMSGAPLDALRRGGLLHDIGKIGISPQILDKPGPLEPHELQRLREHPLLGARILTPIAAFADAIPVVLHHHERFDGKGYPDRLGGEDIPVLARLLAVADVYDALVSSRPYRPGWPIEFAVDTIRKGAGSQFDAVMVDAFLDVMARVGDSARFDAVVEGAGTAPARIAV